jgi:hypothetical protein
MSNTVSIDQVTIQQWVTAKLEPKAVEEQLLATGMDEAAVATHLRAFRQLKNAGRQLNGFICLAVGALLGFISCMLSVFNPIPELYNVILFGLTSISISIICLGLYFLFE